MKQAREIGVAVLLGSAILLTPPSVAGGAGKEVTARGQVVCLDKAGAVLALAAECDPSASGFDHFGLKTAAGQIFAFMPGDSRTAMFTDSRVRARELEVSGWLTADGRVEITKIFSVVDGKLHDLYYFCSVCNIQSHTPGPCWCCRADFELKEEPHKNP